MKVKLQKYIEKYGDGIHGTPCYDENGEYYFVNGNNLENGKVNINDDTLRITKKEYEKIKRPLTPNTILLSINGSLGKIAIYNDEKIALGKSACYLNVKENENKYFVKYVLSTDNFKKYMSLVAHGSTIKNLAPSQVVEYEFEEPKNRDKIALTLKKIDDKIDNNSKIISELESMAKTIYDYWFLQYEFPNEEGKPYKSSGGKMSYNKNLKREIPEDWCVKSLKECIEHINTGLNPRDNFVLGNGSIKYITVKNLTKEGIFNYDGCDVIDEKAKEIVHNRSDVDAGDILFASIAPLGRCFMVQEYPSEWDINESVFCIRPRQQIVSTEYLYLYFTSEMFIKQAENSSTGSIFSGIRINTLESMNLLVPSKEIKEKFAHNIKNIFLKKYKIAKENEELTKLRDELLPLLMNGQVSFKN